MIEMLQPASLTQSLSDMVEAMRVPIIVVGLLALAATAVEVGRFAVEFVRRRRGRQRPNGLTWQAELQLQAASGSPERVEDALADFELGAQKRLDRTRILVRVGPAIGLMGTLIPLAPGLSALARGDLAELASELQTAFAMTVIGLFIGAVAFMLTVARTRYFAEDLAMLERDARSIKKVPA